MIRAVLDANVLVSAAINPRGTPARLVALWRAARFAVVVSDALLRELYEVFHYPKFSSDMAGQKRRCGPLSASWHSTPSARLGHSPSR